MPEDRVTIKLYQAFPLTTIVRYVAPVVVIWILTIWGIVVIAQPVMLWLVRAAFVVDGFLVAVFAKWMANFFTKRFRAPLLTLEQERLDIRDVSLRWDEISRIGNLDKVGLTLVGVYPHDAQAFLETLTPVQWMYYARQLRAYGGALPVPLVRDITREHLIELLNSYRLGEEVEERLQC